MSVTPTSYRAARVACSTVFFDDMNRLHIAFFLLFSIAGCAHQVREESADPAPLNGGVEAIERFSANPIGALPAHWQPMVIFRGKKQTRYQLVTDHDKTILHARAESASSGLMQQVNVDSMTQPWLSWCWKIGEQADTADVTVHATEDSPARIILGFDGDKDTLPFVDQIMFETARVVTGYDFPYATLMYVWESKAPIGTVLPSGRSERIKKMVVANGPDGVGQWRDFSRNIVEDFQKAFGEKPGHLIGVGVLTDTEAVGDTAEAWYGDIRLQATRSN
jgi:hypothetical protein